MAEELRDVEVFRAGRHVDSRGRTREFGEAELARLVESYDPAKHEAPLVIGHPQHNAPAFGWVRKLRRQGELVLADFSDVSPEFLELLKVGAFKKRSLSLYPDGSLRHVGFLGAAAPAVKGLRDVNFSDDESSLFEFGEISELPGLLDRLRGWIAERFGGEEAARIFNNQEADQETVNPEQDEKLKRLEESLSEFSEQARQKDGEIVRLKRQNQALGEKLAVFEGARKREEIANFCQTLTAKGQLTPYQAELAGALLLGLDESKIEFVEAGEKQEKPGGSALRELLNSLPSQIDFQEAATFDRAAGVPSDDPLELANRINEFMETQRQCGREVGYAEAAQILAQQGGSR